MEFLRAEVKSKNVIIDLLTKTTDCEEFMTNSEIAFDVNKNLTPKNYKNNVDKRINNVQKRTVQNKERGDLSITLNDADTTHDNVFSDDGFTPVISKRKKSAKYKRTITVLGDSIVKDCKPYKMKHKLPQNEKLYIKSFSGATIEDMVDYAKPTVRRKPDLIILHAGSNDLRSEKTSDNISSDIMRLALQLKTDINDVMVSSITSRADSYNAKGAEVNSKLKIECERYNLMFIDHSNISADKHLNGSGLHLNYKGTVTLANNFLSHIKT